MSKIETATAESYVTEDLNETVISAVIDDFQGRKALWLEVTADNEAVLDWITAKRMGEALIRLAEKLKWMD